MVEVIATKYDNGSDEGLRNTFSAVGRQFGSPQRELELQLKLRTADNCRRVNAKGPTLNLSQQDC